MSGISLDINEFLRLADHLPVMDVRTPGEYRHAHIPGAHNLPLFSNEERSVIGTLYLKKGSAEAITKGLEFIGPKMKTFAKTGHVMAPGGEALMHCWRGGMRSSSMAWLMNTVGIKTRILDGGYKIFRRFVAETFGKPFKLVVIGGMTGSGKTKVLRALGKQGKQIVDLEQLALHKGSVFGGIGMPDQPSCEQFENNLHAVLRKLDASKPAFIEDESLVIGKVFIPHKFYDCMSGSSFIRLDVPFENRLFNLVKDYSKGSSEELIECVAKIGKRMGMENATRAMNRIAGGDLHSAAVLILKYYDKYYNRSMNRHERKRTDAITVTNENPDQVANMINTITDKWN